MNPDLREEFISHTPEETLQFGRKVGSLLTPGTTLCLHGNLGAGKSQLSKGIISSLMSLLPQEITSPTFTYLNLYEGSFNIYHFDCYRLSSLDEFEKLGFEDYLYDKTSISLVEWPEKILSLLPQRSLHIFIEYLTPLHRLFKLNFGLSHDSI